MARVMVTFTRCSLRLARKFGVIEREARLCHRVVVAYGLVYVGSLDNRVYAVEAATGEIRWQFRTDGGVWSSPTEANGVVYVGSRDSRIYALDAITGALRWRFQADTYRGYTPSVVNGILYVGSGYFSRSDLDASYVYALDAENGKLLWLYQLDSLSYAKPPTVVDDTVFVATSSLGSKSSGSLVYALNAATGERRWNYQTGVDVVSSPVVVEGIVFLDSSGGYAYAIDSATGRLLWRQIASPIYTNPPVVVDGAVYLRSRVESNEFLVAVNARTGESLWRSPMDKGLSYIEVVGDVVYAIAAKRVLRRDDSYVYALDVSTGETLWRFETSEDQLGRSNSSQRCALLRYYRLLAFAHCMCIFAECRKWRSAVALPNRRRHRCFPDR